MKVLVGLSGGVDSAVATYLLLKEGHDVTALFMRNWDNALNSDLEGMKRIGEVCEQEEDYNVALTVSKQLGVTLLRVDFVKEYYDQVFKSFLEEYKKGRTPNPDISCNKEIKFKEFREYAIKNGFDKIATGHYARIKDINGNLFVQKGVDSDKDQSYFLSTLSTTELKDTLFPLGNYTKLQVREIATKLGLVNSTRHGSNGICFIGERRFLPFLKNYLEMKDGDIIDINDGLVVGRHQGVYYYTIGQRSNLGIGGINNKVGPWYIVKKDIKKNLVYVTNIKDDPKLYKKNFILDNVYCFESIDQALVYNIKVRYRQIDIKCNIEIVSGVFHINLLESVRALTPGQQAVIYHDDYIVLSGIVDE